MSSAEDQPAIRLTSDQETGIFYGLEPHWLSRDRLYRIHVSRRGIAAAYVAGQIYDEASWQGYKALVAIYLPICYPLIRPMVQRRLARRQERETAYDSIDPWSSEFSEADARNLRIPTTDLVQICVRRNRSLWTACNAGQCWLELKDGSRRRFILIAGDDPVGGQEQVLTLLKSLNCRMEIEGKLRSPSTPKPRMPVQ